MLDVRRMRVLREVAIRGSFSAAAESLSFTQSAVSQQIAALEREAGAILVERNARGVRLTEAGQTVVRHAEAILCRLSEAEAELEDLAGLRGGRVRLAAFESTASTIMPVAIAAFNRSHPGVELSRTQMDPEDSLPALRAGELDIAMTHASGEPGDRDSEGILHIHVLEDPMLLVLPRDHPLASAPTVRLEDVATEPWVTGPAGCECAKQIELPCMRAGFQPRIAFETGDFAAMQGFVAAGVGVSLIPELGLQTLRDGIVVRSLGDETPVRQIFASVSKGYRSPATEAMLASIRATSVVEAARRPVLEAAA